MKTLLCTTINRPKNKISKKVKQLAVLALIFSQSPLVVKAMVPAENLQTEAESTQGQEAAQQNEQGRTLAVQETTTTTTTPHQEERVTGHRRNFETAFPEENQNSAQPALTRPRLAGQYELAAELGIKDFFLKSEDCFFDITEAIAQNQENLTDPEALRESVNIILQLPIFSESYRSCLDELLSNYTNGEQDQATRGIKVMRYVISKAHPELQEETLSLNTFRQACNFLWILNTINRLTNEQIQRGNLMNPDTFSGQLYERICQQTSKKTITRFFNKIIRAFDGDQEGLKRALTQQDDYGYTPLHKATWNNDNPEVVGALLASLQQAFNGNFIGLQQALTQQDNDEWTPLHAAASNNNPEIIRALIDSLQQAFAGNLIGLQQALTQQDNDGWTPLHFTAQNNNSEVMRVLIDSLHQAFAGSPQGLQVALTRQDNDDRTPLNFTARNDNSEVMRILIDSLQQAFNGNQQGLQIALTRQDNNDRTPLHLAIQNNNDDNHEVIRALIDALQEAFTGNLIGLQDALTRQDDAGWTPLHKAARIYNSEVVRTLIALLQETFADNLVGLQQALTRPDNHGWTPLYYARRTTWLSESLIQDAINQVEAVIDAQEENQ